ncbi:MAG: YheV family putative metal-binding protein [Porticoccus sp.]|jgi:uncharacterized protein|nr:YheV family putative metal-binding protein [Porticoccus sp.]
MFKAKKRFIAGAVCPRCSEMDKLTIFSEAEKEYRECVSCGFKEQMFLQSEPKEINTRVNKTKEEKELEVQPVRLVDPGKLH